jgi:uncharacterized phiE125 gp8 family phage protein
MWYPAKTVEPATAEPVTLDGVKRRLRVSFTDEDADMELMIASARDHAEKYCNVLFAEHTVELRCDCWADLARLPVAPVASVTSIAYVDTDGITTTLPDTEYELLAEALEACIVPTYGKQWPAIQSGSRITVTAVVGYGEAPPAVKHALLLFIADAYEVRENAKVEDWTALDALLCNYRRG